MNYSTNKVQYVILLSCLTTQIHWRFRLFPDFGPFPWH